jgi:hypothetical protein
MPQLSYSLNTPFATQPGSAASSMPEECYTGLGLVSGAQTVTATVANSTAYQLTFVTSAGNRTATYTSDGSATKAEIVAGLQAAVNALGDADYAAFNVGGDLVLQPKAGVSSPRAVSSTGAGTLAIASRSGILPFGVAVALDVTRFDSNDPQTLPVRLPNASTDKILGIVRFTQFFESYGASVASLPAGQSVNVAKKGHFWVSPEVAVTAGDPVYARHTANGGLTQLGALRNDADTSNAIQLAGCRFLSSALAGGFAVVELNLP